MRAVAWLRRHATGLVLGELALSWLFHLYLFIRAVGNQNGVWRNYEAVVLTLHELALAGLLFLRLRRGDGPR